ncbi:MAG TPA: DoxX family protein [Bacteroidales bacterium]|nr:DoxX family protein [Bacteroidales bacterium]
MKAIRTISRIFLGAVFIFSGFVKAVDPWGSAYKFHDYFTAFHMEWLTGLALPLGVALCLAEFMIGVGLLFGTRMRFFAWALMVFMTYFLFLTLYLAIANPVSDCGCFGDAIKMTNWETFYKNVVLMVPTLIVFFGRHRYSEPYSRKGQALVLGLGAAVLLGTSVYSYRHLPLIDFLPWKEGNRIADQVVPVPEISEIYLQYRDKESGEMVEYTSATLPWQDSVLMARLEFVDQRKEVIQEFQDAPIHDFEINDAEHNDHTADFIGNPDYQFLLIVSSVDKTSRSAFERANLIAGAAQAGGYSFIALTGSSLDRAEQFRREVGGDYDWYNVDETALKSVVRSNPGLVLLHDGVVVKKWHYNDFPDPEVLDALFLGQGD